MTTKDLIIISLNEIVEVHVKITIGAIPILSNNQSSAADTCIKKELLNNDHVLAHQCSLDKLLSSLVIVDSLHSILRSS